MKKRLWATLLVVCMVVSLLPVTAFAVDSFSPAPDVPALGSTATEQEKQKNQINADTYYLLTETGTLSTADASESHYNIYYHENTITLNNAALKTGLYIPGNTTLEFIGENSSDNSSDGLSTAIQTMTEGDITIQGTGSFTTTRNEGILLYEQGSLNVCGSVTLDLTSVGSASSIIVRDGVLNIQGSAKVMGKKLASDKNNIEISGSAIVEAANIDADQKVVIGGDSKVTVNGVTISGDSGIEVKDNAEVSATTSSVSLNAFYGPITIDSTKKLTAKTTIANGAAIAAGVSQATDRTDVTIKSEVEIEGYVGIAANGANSSVMIDGGNVNVTSKFIGLYTQSQNSPGTVDIKNNAVVHVKGTGNATPGIATYSRNPQPINIENSSVTVENCGYGLSGSAINLKDSDITVSSSTYAFLKVPALDYSYPVTVRAGDTADDAVVIPPESLENATYYNKFVQIVPAPQHTITYYLSPTDPDAYDTCTVYASMNHTVIDAPSETNSVFTGWLASDGETYYAGQEITPTGDLTLTAQWQKIDDWSEQPGADSDGRLDVDVDVSVNVDVAVQVGVSAEVSDVQKDALNDRVRSALTGVMGGETPTGMTDETASELRGLLGRGASEVEATLTVYAELKETPTEDALKNLLGEQFASGETAQQWDLRVTLTTAATAANGDDLGTVTAVITETTPITFTLTTGQDLSGKEVRVLYRHEGAVGTAESSVTDAANGVVQVTAGKFSPYVILSKDKPSSGGGHSSSGGAASYSVSVADKNPAGGTVRTDKSSAIAGATVTVTVSPESGYVLDRLTVTDKSGKQVALTDKGSGKYTFVMPAGAVTVSAAFRAEQWNTSAADCPKDETCPIAPFADAQPDAWYHDGVHFCLQNGLIAGYDDGTFRPDAGTTRAMIAVMLWRLNGSPVVNYALPFEDVQPDTWYTEAIRWAVSAGVAQGYGDGSFGPDDVVTREQMVTILWRYAQAQNCDVSVGENTNILSYQDAFSVAEYAVPAMQSVGLRLRPGDRSGPGRRRDPRPAGQHHPRPDSDYADALLCGHFEITQRATGLPHFIAGRSRFVSRRITGTVPVIRKVSAPAWSPSSAPSGHLPPRVGKAKGHHLSQPSPQSGEGQRAPPIPAFPPEWGRSKGTTYPSLPPRVGKAKWHHLSQPSPQGGEGQRVPPIPAFPTQGGRWHAKRDG